MDPLLVNTFTELVCRSGSIVAKPGDRFVEHVEGGTMEWEIISFDAGPSLNVVCQPVGGGAPVEWQAIRVAAALLQTQDGIARNDKGEILHSSRAKVQPKYPGVSE